MKQQLKLENGVTLEIDVTQTGDDCITMSHTFFKSDGTFLSKSCSQTCGTGSSAKTYSWTCAENQNCSGSCADPNNPTGTCY